MQSQQKTKVLSIFAVAVLATMLISISAIPHEVDAQKQESKKKPEKPKACNNVKVRVQVTGAEVNDTLVGSATVGITTVTKVVTVENDTEATTLAFNFKKVSPCPPIGSEIFGNVNGTGFTGELKSLKKPNKISVEL